MKKFSIVMLLFFVSVSYLYSQETKTSSAPASPVTPVVQNKADSKSKPAEFSGKIGTGYASQAEKFGLDLSANYSIVLDKYFTAGFELDMLWLSWERTLGQKEIGQTSATVKANTDAFIFPFFFNAQIRFPDLFKSVNIIPSLVIGLGWTGMIMNDKIPEYSTDGGLTYVKADDNTDIYGGFAWQIYSSIAYKPAGSGIAFVFDLGYRGTSPSSDGIEFDMSGFMTKAGVKFFY